MTVDEMLEALAVASRGGTSVWLSRFTEHSDEGSRALWGVAIDLAVGGRIEARGEKLVEATGELYQRVFTPGGRRRKVS